MSLKPFKTFLHHHQLIQFQNAVFLVINKLTSIKLLERSFQQKIAKSITMPTLHDALFTHVVKEKVVYRSRTPAFALWSSCCASLPIVGTFSDGQVQHEHAAVTQPCVVWLILLEQLDVFKLIWANFYIQSTFCNLKLVQSVKEVQLKFSKAKEKNNSSQPFAAFQGSETDIAI